MQLGHKRAMAAGQYLMDQGVAAHHISTESFGYSRPVATMVPNGVVPETAGISLSGLVNRIRYRVFVIQ